jgi:hypothetical protein
VNKQDSEQRIPYDSRYGANGNGVLRFAQDDKVERGPLMLSRGTRKEPWVTLEILGSRQRTDAELGLLISKTPSREFPTTADTARTGMGSFASLRMTR